MAETKINANQTNITASDIGAQDTLQYSAFPGHPSSSSYSAETTSEWEGKIIQYTGVKQSGSLWPGEDAVVNTGVFLKATSATSGTPRASATYTSSVITRVTVNATTFVNTMKQYIPNHDFVGENRFVYDADSWAWVLQPDGVVIGEFWPDFEAEWRGMAALGIAISPSWGEFQDGDTIVVTISGITKKYYWKPVNVDAVALANTATSSAGLTIVGTPATSGINIGAGSSTNGGVSIGSGAQGNDGGTGVAVGQSTQVRSANCISIGYDAISGFDNGAGTAPNGIAIGTYSRTNAPYAIQLGSIGTDDQGGAYNDVANTFKVANQNGNFEIMSADGTIPEARLADTTSTQEGDTLTLNSSGNAVWTSPLQYVLGGLQTTDSSKVGYLQYYFEENNAVSAPAGGKWLVLDCLKVNTSNGVAYVFSADFTSPVGSIVAGGTQIAAARSGYTTRALLLKVE